MSAESHNRIAPEIVIKLVKECDGQDDCFVTLESVILGVMSYYAPNPRHAAEYLDSMTAAVIERMKP